MPKFSETVSLELYNPVEIAGPQTFPVFNWHSIGGEEQFVIGEYIRLVETPTLCGSVATGETALIGEGKPKFELQGEAIRGPGLQPETVITEVTSIGVDPARGKYSLSKPATGNATKQQYSTGLLSSADFALFISGKEAAEGKRREIEGALDEYVTFKPIKLVSGNILEVVVYEAYQLQQIHVGLVLEHHIG